MLVGVAGDVVLIVDGDDIVRDVALNSAELTRELGSDRPLDRSALGRRGSRRQPAPRRRHCSAMRAVGSPRDGCR